VSAPDYSIEDWIIRECPHNEEPLCLCILCGGVLDHTAKLRTELDAARIALQSAESDVATLRDGLLSLRREHDGTCRERSEVFQVACACGADETNAAIDRILTATERGREPGRNEK